MAKEHRSEWGAFGAHLERAFFCVLCVFVHVLRVGVSSVWSARFVRSICCSQQFEFARNCERKFFCATFCSFQFTIHNLQLTAHSSQFTIRHSETHLSFGRTFFSSQPANCKLRAANCELPTAPNCFQLHRATSRP